MRPALWSLALCGAAGRAAARDPCKMESDPLKRWPQWHAQLHSYRASEPQHAYCKGGGTIPDRGFCRGD